MHAHIKQIKFFKIQWSILPIITGNLQCIWWDIHHLRLISWFIFFTALKKTLVPNYLTVFIYLFWIIDVLNWLDLNFSELLSKSILNVHENMKEIHVYLQYVRFQAWFHEHLFLVSNTVMKLSWAWVPVHTEIDNIYLQNLWHNGSIDYLRVQTVGPSKLFLFYDPVSIFESMHIVWRKSCLNEKIPDPVRTKCCWLLLLYTVNDHLISAKRSKLPFPFIRGI